MGTLSLERHRLLWLYLKNETSFFQENNKILHVAPEQCYYSFFKKYFKNYVTVDLDSPLAEYKADVCDMPFESNSFDACYSHMLYCMALTLDELIKLNKEIKRVLKPGGVNIYTARNTDDGDYKKGIHRGEDLYEIDGFIIHFFSKKISEANEAGINNLIVDPGFGFGKTIDQNYEILSHLNVFKTLELPILVGLSRKSMIYKPLSITPKEALNGTSILHTKALLQGANILRVHDVKAAKECIDLVALMQ